MYEIDLGSPSLGQDPDEDGAVILDFPSQGFGTWDMSGLNATSWEIGATLDAAAETDAGMEAEALAALPDAELDELAAEADFDTWADSLIDNGRWDAIRAESGAYGEQEVDFLHTAHRLDRLMANQQQLEATRQAEDQADRARRTGPRHRRPTDEVCLANALDRYGRGSYLYGQDIGLANDPDLDALLEAGPAAGPVGVWNEMIYQLTGQGAPLARSLEYRQPLPRMSARRLTRLGLLP
jgi:hypothetical protein